MSILDEIRPPFTHTDIQNFIDYYRAENKLVKENRALYDKVVGNNFERGNKEMSFDYERDMVHKVIDGVRNDFSNDEMLTREYINTIIAALEELKVNDFLKNKIMRKSELRQIIKRKEISKVLNEDNYPSPAQKVAHILKSSKLL